MYISHSRVRPKQKHWYPNERHVCACSLQEAVIEKVDGQRQNLNLRRSLRFCFRGLLLPLFLCSVAVVHPLKQQDDLTVRGLGEQVHSHRPHWTEGRSFHTVRGCSAEARNRHWKSYLDLFKWHE